MGLQHGWVEVDPEEGAEVGTLLPLAVQQHKVPGAKVHGTEEHPVSDADEELAETRWKLQAMLGALLRP